MADEHEDLRPSRRIVFSGLGALGVAVALAGCGGNAGGGGTASGGASTPKAKVGQALARTSEIPVGGGMILTDQRIVVTQPSQGEFKAFSAICTHQGFTVTSVSADIIHCNHHGSEYSAATGKVERGPAPTALAAVAIKVQGTSIVAG